MVTLFMLVFLFFPMFLIGSEGSDSEPASASAASASREVVVTVTVQSRPRLPSTQKSPTAGTIASESDILTHHRIPFSQTAVPHLKDADMLDLYHLRSFPVSIVDSKAGKFTLQTSGIAMRSTETSELIILEYLPLNSSCSLLPIIQRENGNITSLVWDKRAQIYYHSTLDKNYWQQSTFLARINGVVYENYLKFVDKYLLAHQFFVPEFICSGTAKDSCFTHATTWESFVSESFEVISSLAVVMNAIIPPRASEAILISFMEPERVCWSNLLAEEASTSSASPISRGDNRHHNATAVPIERGTSNKGTDIDIEVTATDNTSEKETNDSFIVSLIEEQSRHFKERQPTRTQDIATYYSELMTCMTDYDRENYYVALTSCLKEVPSFVHDSSDCYYRIVPKRPYSLVNEYYHEIPSENNSHTLSADTSDIAIGSLLIALACIGTILALVKLKVIDWLWSKTSSIRRRRMSLQPPAEGGYSKAASELPVYSDWCRPCGSKLSGPCSSCSSSSSSSSPCLYCIHGTVSVSAPRPLTEEEDDYEQWSDKVRMNRLFGGFAGFGGGGGGSLESLDGGRDDSAAFDTTTPRVTRGSMSREGSFELINREYQSVLHFNSMGRLMSPSNIPSGLNEGQHVSQAANLNRSPGTAPPVPLVASQTSSNSLLSGERLRLEALKEQ